jgi:quercetin dioxygenase-like cupin family protein
MYSVTKGWKCRDQIASACIVSLLLVVVVSGLLVSVADVHSQSIVGPDEGRVLQVLGEAITVKIGGEQTGGRYAVIEEVSPVDSGPPLHLHRHEDEIFYVVEGEIEFQRGDQRFRAKAGSTAFLPKDVPHTFRNVGTTPSKVHVVIIPARFVGFFEDINALTKPTPEQAVELGKKYDLTFPPPPKGN